MVSFKCITILFLTVIALVQINTALDINNGRIVGGIIAKVGQFPHHVSLHNIAKDVYICGGFIINQRWIGSAAHCTVTLLPSNLELIYGTVSLSQGGIKNTAELIINHSGYISVKLLNDVSIIKTVNPIFFTDSVKPVILDSSFDYGGRQAVVSGHGSLQVGVENSEFLQYISKNTISNAECLSSLDYSRASRIAESSLCTLNPNGEGICNGDAGSALIYDGALIGIASWGVPCGQANPDVYSRISSYVGWFLEQIRNN